MVSAEVTSVPCHYVANCARYSGAASHHCCEKHTLGHGVRPYPDSGVHGNARGEACPKCSQSDSIFGNGHKWRRCMGIEPTQDGTSALLTVLKTAEPTRTLPPPRSRERPRFRYITLSPPMLEEDVLDGLVKKILIPVIIDSRCPLKASDISL